MSTNGHSADARGEYEPNQPPSETNSYRFLVSIHHPAQAHFYRHIIDELRADGHQVRVCVRDKEMAAALLRAFDIEHRVLARTRESLLGTALTQATYETKLLWEAVRFQPDVVSSVGGIEISHIAPLVGAKALAFTDTPPRFSRLITLPSIDATCTPTGFEGAVRGEQRRYEGYQELAYLHPDRFEPDPDCLRTFGVDPDEPVYVVRFVNFDAHHDVGEHGFTAETKRELVTTLSKHGTVYVSSEQPLPDYLESYELPIPPELIHDLLSVADLYVGDSGTMATEAALLGTPSVRVCSTVDSGDLSNFLELEESFGLLYSFGDGSDALRAVERVLEEPRLQEEWTERRADLVEEKIDVVEYAVEQHEQLGMKARHEPHGLYG